MEIPNKQLVAGAFAVMLGSNAGSFVNAFSPDFRANSFTDLDGEQLRADMLELYNTHLFIEQKELEQIRRRISECEFKIK